MTDCKHPPRACHWMVSTVPRRRLPRILLVCGACGEAREFLVLRRGPVVARYKVKAK